MKKLLIAMAALMACQAQAGWLKTEKEFFSAKVVCVNQKQPEVILERTMLDSKRKSNDPFIMEVDGTGFWPQLVGQNKIMFVKEANNTGDWKRIDFGTSKSSSYIRDEAYTMNNGETYLCSIEMGKYLDSAPISIIPAF
ncbi:hypothetical protein [Bdellovibrio sp. HCB337]|uniref:hypothetical protein n=1 Tax=Bdellovibrio sp. HCB337 TaxID=3394358 RepID=UPI0039A7729B